MEVERKYQTFWPRAWAGLVDGIVFMPVELVNRGMYDDSVPVWARAGWYVFHSLTFVAYVVVMHAMFGQTLGKMATHVRVLDLSEAKLSPRQAVLREAVPLVLTLLCLPSGIAMVVAGGNPTKPEFQALGVSFWLSAVASLGWFAAELITMLTNAKRRAVHDFIARSVVVRSEPASLREFGGVV